MAAAHPGESDSIRGIVVPAGARDHELKAHCEMRWSSRTMRRSPFDSGRFFRLRQLDLENLVRDRRFALEHHLRRKAAADRAAARRVKRQQALADCSASAEENASWSESSAFRRAFRHSDHHAYDSFSRDTASRRAAHRRLRPSRCVALSFVPAVRIVEEHRILGEKRPRVDIELP